MNVEQFGLSLTRVRELSPSTRDFRFVRVDGSPIEYRPGQFYRFGFTDHNGYFERSYSIATLSGEVGRSYDIDLLISSVTGGRATNYLFDKDIKKLVGEVKCSAKGPYGRLVVPEKLPQRLILVATSVGLAPYLPILNQLDSLLHQHSLEVVLLLGVRSPIEFIYANNLVEYERNHSRFTLTVCYSREVPLLPGKYDFSGYVQNKLAEMTLDPDQDHVLLCGNPGMIDAAYQLLKTRGFSVRNVVREKYVYARESIEVQRPSLTEAQKNLIAEKLRKNTVDK